MKVKAIISTLTLCLLCGTLAARQKDTLSVEQSYTREFLDTVEVRQHLVINDYTSIGFQYGVALNKMSFNPSKSQTFLFTPRNFGVTYSRYGKMFGYMPYFGLQLGLFVGQDGFRTKLNKETDSRPDVDGAYEAVYDYVEVPMLALFHYDILRFRLMANLGLYGGYRFGIHRSGGENFDIGYADKFRDYEIRLDYGIKGGAGFALLFDPVEIHVQAQLRYGFSSIYEPDYYSQYYYRYAYPFDIVISAGLQFQLTRRTGKTNAQLRREARSLVYNEESKR